MLPESVEVCSKNASVSIERIEFKKIGNAVNLNGECFLQRDVDFIAKVPTLNLWVAVISAKNHKRQRRKRQSVTAKREKSQTP